MNSFGSKNDTYDDVIRNMSAAYEEFIALQYKRLSEKNKFKKMVV